MRSDLTDKQLLEYLSLSRLPTAAANEDEKEAVDEEEGEEECEDDALNNEEDSNEDAHSSSGSSDEEEDEDGDGTDEEEGRVLASSSTKQKPRAKPLQKVKREKPQPVHPAPHARAMKSSVGNTTAPIDVDVELASSAARPKRKAPTDLTAGKHKSKPKRVAVSEGPTLGGGTTAAPMLTDLGTEINAFCRAALSAITEQLRQLVFPLSEVLIFHFIFLGPKSCATRLGHCPTAAPGAAAATTTTTTKQLYCSSSSSISVAATRTSTR